MNKDTTHTPRRPSGGRIAALVASGVVTLMSLGFLATGGLLLWADSEKEQGYLSTDSERFSTDTRALVTENLDLDFDGPESLVESDVYGKVRVKAESNDGKPVFVGIARTSDISDYLRGSSHDVITDIDYSPFRVDYSTQPGDGRPGRPSAQRFWEATAADGELTWDVEDGDWSVVVMNADGSPGVDADVSAGARLGFLDEAGSISLGTGLVLLAIAGGLLIVGVRPRREAAVTVS
jgi:hypothetical protein